MKLFIYSYTMTGAFKENKLSIGWRGHFTTAAKDEALVSMTNIKVYQDVYEQSNVNNFNDGDVLLHMDTQQQTTSLQSHQLLYVF